MSRFIARVRSSALVLSALSGLLATVDIVRAGVVPVELIAHWTGDRTVADSSGNGYDLVPIGRPGYRAGAVGTAFDIFAGAHLDAPDLSGGAHINPSAITVTAWIKEDAPANSGSMLNVRTPSNTSGFTLEPQFGTPGVLLWAVHTTNGYQLLTAPYGPVGSTVFVAATFSAVEKRMALYVNGALVNSLTTSDATDCRLLATETLRVGANMVNGLAFDGFIDDAQLYGDALSCRAIEWMFAHPGEAVATDTPPDLTGDGTINASDLAILLGAWGECDPRALCEADLNCSGSVDAADLAILLGAWST